jgi:hypothetical protein
MLNRTNLTLSALSNRLNLGTRSLVLPTSVNHGANAPRIRQSHHDVMRDEMVWYVVSSFKAVKCDIPPIPDTVIPGQQQRPVRCSSRQPGRPACASRVQPRPRPDWSVMPIGTGRESLGSRLPGRTTSLGGTKPAEPRHDRRSEPAGTEGSRQAARRAPGSAAAAIAALAEA